MSRLRGTAADLRPLLAPRSVAIVGASERAGNMGGTAVRLLQKFAFRGAIWPVHPTLKTVYGVAAYAHPGQLPGVADVAILALPAEGLLQAINDCADAGIRHGIAWAGGFAEAGDAGLARQQALVDLCKAREFRLLGPNCLGLINAPIGFTGTFTSALLDLDSLRPCSIAMVSQSGGIGTNANALANRQGFGFRTMISCGNEAVLGVADFMHALIDDEETRIIAVYVEAISDGPAFRDALDAAREAGKPVIVLKGGATRSSVRATIAHTGRFSGEDRVFDTILKDAAAIRVHALEELLDVALLLETTRGTALPRGRGVVLPTFGGGGGVLASDQCDRAGLEVPALTERTRARLGGLLTPLASLENPVDMTPQSVNDPAWLERLPEALAVLPEDDNIDAMLFLGAAMKHRENELIGVLDTLRRRSRKPVVVSWTNASDAAQAGLRKIGIYSFPDSGRAAIALGHMVRYGESLARSEPDGHQPPPSATSWSAQTFPVLKGVVTEDVAAGWLRACGLPVAEGRLARDADEAVAIAKAIGFPIALKVISSAIAHRSAAGLVRLGIARAEDVAATFDRFRQQAAGQGVTIDGCYVQKMAPPGRELLVSAFRDPIFGPMVVCGAGGVLTELIEDSWAGGAPFSPQTAERKLLGMKMAGNSLTALGADARAHAARFLSQFSQLVAGLPWSRYTLELNPVLCNPDGVMVVDALLIEEAVTDGGTESDHAGR